MRKLSVRQFFIRRIGKEYSFFVSQNTSCATDIFSFAERVHEIWLIEPHYSYCTRAVLEKSFCDGHALSEGTHFLDILQSSSYTYVFILFDILYGDCLGKVLVQSGEIKKQIVYRRNPYFLEPFLKYRTYPLY